MTIIELAEKMLEYKASDLYLTVGLPPTWRNDGVVAKGEHKLLEEEIWRMAAEVIKDEDFQKLRIDKELNITFENKQGDRFRVNFFLQQQKPGAVIRRIEKVIPKLEDLGLPEILKEAIMLERGLVLIAGTSGSGKSSSIASMLGYRNECGSGHIITVEDPIEFVHEHKNCIFTQREIGIDTNSWSAALKNALRQRPDVIYIGEIRDAETMEHAINFAETGHLCIATLHAQTAPIAIERIVNFFPSVQKNQILFSLSQVLELVFAQRLVPTVNESRVLTYEILKNAGLIKSLIADGSINEIRELMGKNQDIGMMTFDHNLKDLLAKGIISKDVAIAKSDNPEYMRLEIMKSRVKIQSYKDETGF